MSLNYVALKNLHAQVIAWLEQGIPQKAKKKLDELTFEEKDNLFVEYLQGICEQELGNREKAIRHFKYLISQDPTFVRAAEALYHLAEDSLSVGEKKYLCQIIHLHRPDDEKIKKFLDAHAEVPTELILKPLQSSGESQLIDDTFTAAEEKNETEAMPDLELIEDSAEAQAAPGAADEMESPQPKDDVAGAADTKAVIAETAVEDQPEPEESPAEAADTETKEPDSEPEEKLASESPLPEATIIPEAQPESEETVAETDSEEKAPEPSPEENLPEAEIMSEPKSKNLRQKTKTKRKIANYETLTMAQVYKEQGLFEQSLNILEKLLENSIDPDRVHLEINKVKKLMEEKDSL
ncbi:MAG TPA: hypothetical protein ENN84_05750 [Candidatus Marinimicrobia bacterium]|nr:hypothetical protein [Candidatus Neomarinimicrobiota bacterium]